MVLTDVHLLERPVDRARNREEHIVEFIVIPARQGLDLLTAERIGFAGGFVLNGRQRRHDFKRDLLCLREGQGHRSGRLGPDLHDGIFTAIGILHRAHGIGSLGRQIDGEFPGLVRDRRAHDRPFLVLHLHRCLRHPPKILVLHRPGNRSTFGNRRLLREHRQNTEREGYQHHSKTHMKHTSDRRQHANLPQIIPHRSEPDTKPWLRRSDESQNERSDGVEVRSEAAPGRRGMQGAIEK